MYQGTLSMEEITTWLHLYSQIPSQTRKLGLFPCFFAFVYGLSVCLYRMVAELRCMLFTCMCGPKLFSTADFFQVIIRDCDVLYMPRSPSISFTGEIHTDWSKRLRYVSLTMYISSYDGTHPFSLFFSFYCTLFVNSTRESISPIFGLLEDAKICQKGFIILRHFCT